MQLVQRQRKLTLILDRGFEEFQIGCCKTHVCFRWSTLLFRSLGRYPRELVNVSRNQVTSIRYIVENVQASQKHFKIHCDPVTPKFVKDRFHQYHPLINATERVWVDKSIRWPSRDFVGEEKAMLLRENPSFSKQLYRSRCMTRLAICPIAVGKISMDRTWLRRCTNSAYVPESWRARRAMSECWTLLGEKSKGLHSKPPESLPGTVRNNTNEVFKLNKIF